MRSLQVLFILGHYVLFFKRAIQQLLQILQTSFMLLSKLLLCIGLCCSHFGSMKMGSFKLKRTRKLSSDVFSRTLKQALQFGHCINTVIKRPVSHILLPEVVASGLKMGSRLLNFKH